MKSRMTASSIESTTVDCCGHYIHPGTPQRVVICPSYTAGQLFDEFSALTELWEERRTPGLGGSPEDEVY